jgi:hypothetical protein
MASGPFIASLSITYSASNWFTWNPYEFTISLKEGLNFKFIYPLGPLVQCFFIILI